MANVTKPMPKNFTKKEMSGDFNMKYKSYFQIVLFFNHQSSVQDFEKY